MFHTLVTTAVAGFVVGLVANSAVISVVLGECEYGCATDKDWIHEEDGVTKGCLHYAHPTAHIGLVPQPGGTKEPLPPAAQIRKWKCPTYQCDPTCTPVVEDVYTTADYNSGSTQGCDYMGFVTRHECKL